jgi:nickel-dependent lactate racemase
MELPLGEGTIDVALPDCDVTVAEPAGGEPVDVAAAAERALDRPLGPSLADRAGPGQSVAIVVTDVTRATPDDVLLDALFDRLDAAGVDREAVTIVVGLGLHRPLSETEIADAYGEHADLVVNHEPEAAIEVGEVDGVPIEVNPAVASADLVLATGMVEPHQYAGFSGGAKTVAVGAGGEPLIRYTHGPELLGEDGVRLGRVEGNPFREFVDRAGQLAGPDLCLNVTHGPSGVLDVAAGSPRPVVRELAESARAALSVPIEDEFDAVVAGVGAPKDANLYQASRAATYVALGDRNPLRDGGRIVVPAELSEGAGQGTGEQRFLEWCSEASDPASLYAEMAAGYEPGAQRAFVLARVLREFDVYVTNSQAPDVVEACLMEARATVADAVEPGSDVLVVPDAIDTLLDDPDRGN